MIPGYLRRGDAEPEYPSSMQRQESIAEVQAEEIDV
jgi:hypothetical protein